VATVAAAAPANKKKSYNKKKKWLKRAKKGKTTINLCGMLQTCSSHLADSIVPFA